MILHTKINDRDFTLDIPANAMLLDVLREAGFKSVKKGCGTGHCGSCTILFNGVPRNACLIFAGQVEGAEVMTVEGMGTYENPHPLQIAMVESGSTQCGFCNPGSLLSAKALLESKPNPSEADIKEALDGNLCRCTGYVKRIEAIQNAAKEMNKAKKSPKKKIARGKK